MAVYPHPAYLHQGLSRSMRGPVVPLVCNDHNKDLDNLNLLNHVDHDMLVIYVACKVEDDAHEQVSQFTELSRVKLCLYQK